MSDEFVDLSVYWPQRYGHSTNLRAEVVHRVISRYSFVRYFFRRTEVPVDQRMMLWVYWVCGQQLSNKFPPILLNDAQFARVILQRERRLCRWCSDLDKSKQMILPRTKRVVSQF